MDQDAFKFRRFDDAHVAHLMGWFADESACRSWGGPGFRFPFTETTFREDTRLGTLRTWSLVDAEDELLAFGQYYFRVGRCHLAHLAVKPAFRGHRVGERLVLELCRVGSDELRVDSYSLFVMSDNTPALRLYDRIGFAPVAYPDPSPKLEGMVYMVASTLRCSVA
jgi:ribosomal protein S18 acetylase RimI-like enzyme